MLLCPVVSKVVAKINRSRDVLEATDYLRFTIVAMWCPDATTAGRADSEKRAL